RNVTYCAGIDLVSRSYSDCRFPDTMPCRFEPGWFGGRMKKMKNVIMVISSARTTPHASRLITYPTTQPTALSLERVSASRGLACGSDPNPSGLRARRPDGFRRPFL